MGDLRAAVDEKHLVEVERMYALGATFIPTSGKLPVFKGYHERPRDTLEMTLAWARGNNLAIKTGSASGGIVIVDIEAEAEPGIISKLGLPPTATVRTGGGGMHLYYRTSRKLKTVGPGKLADKVEFKAERSLATFVGSVHPDTGAIYEWMISPEVAGVAELPAKFIERHKEVMDPEYRPPRPPAPERKLDDNHPYVMQAVKEETEKVSSAQEGTRNASLNEAAFALGTLVGARVLSRDSAERELMSAALQSGLPEKEAQGTIKSGLDGGEKQPRQIPESITKDNEAKAKAIPASSIPPSEMPPAFDVSSVVGLFLASHQRILHHRDIYYIYTGRCYRPLTDSEMRSMLTKFICGSEHDRKKWLLPHTRKDHENGLIGIRSETGKLMAAKEVNPAPAFLNEALELIRGFGIQPSNLDLPFWTTTGQPARDCLCMKNGILRLTASKLEPLTPDCFTTVALDYEYDPSADCPRWRQFLTEVSLGDEGMQMVLQEIFGCCLSHSQDGQKIFIFAGEGKNGKTVTVNTLRMVVGPANCSATPLEFLNQPHATASLVGKLANFSMEWSRIEAQAEGLLKAISGGDAVLINPKHKGTFSVVLSTKFVITSNQPPYVTDRSHGMWRRLLVVPFRFVVPDNKEVPQEALLDEFRKELPGILNWALLGLGFIRMAKGFTETKDMLAAKDEYRRGGSPAWMWADENLKLDPQSTLSCEEAYRHYRHWAEEHGNKPMNSTHLGIDLSRWYKEQTRKDITKSRLRGSGLEGRTFYYTGLRFSVPADEYPSPTDLFDRREESERGSGA